MLQSLSNYLKQVLSQHQTRNNFKFSHKVHFSKGFLGKISVILPICIIERNSIWKLRVNGIISVTGTRVNVYQIS